MCDLAILSLLQQQLFQRQQGCRLDTEIMYAQRQVGGQQGVIFHRDAAQVHRDAVGNGSLQDAAYQPLHGGFGDAGRCLGGCGTSLTVSALGIMRYCLKVRISR